MSMNNLVAPSVTGWSNFWGDTPDSYQFLSRESGSASAIPGSGAISRAFMLLGTTGRKGFNKKLRQMVANGVSGNATATHKRVEAVRALNDASVMGGSRTIETVSSFPGDSDGVVAVTAADRDAFIDLLDRFIGARPTSYASDASGNGGGGKAFAV